MGDDLLDNKLINEFLVENNANDVICWYKKGLKFLDEKTKKEDSVKKWMKDAQAKISSLTNELEMKDQLISNLRDKNTNISVTVEELIEKCNALKKENERLKMNQENQAPTGIHFRDQFERNKIQETSRAKKTSPKSPLRDGDGPEKNKKLKNDWINKQNDPSPLSRKSSGSLSLKKPFGTKLKQTYLNFTTEEPSLNETYCSEVENVGRDSTSPSRFRKPKVTKVLAGLKELKVEKDEDEDLFNTSHLDPTRTNTKEEPESQGMNTAVMFPMESENEAVCHNTQESRDSDVIILPTQESEVIEVFDDTLRLPLLQTIPNLKGSKSFDEKTILQNTTVNNEDSEEYIPGHCKKCVDYYNNKLPGGFHKENPFVIPCHHELGRRLRPDTPEGFWNPVFTPTPKN